MGIHHWHNIAQPTKQSWRDLEMCILREIVWLEISNCFTLTRPKLHQNVWEPPIFRPISFAYYQMVRELFSAWIKGPAEYFWWNDQRESEIAHFNCISNILTPFPPSPQLHFECTIHSLSDHSRVALWIIGEGHSVSWQETVLQRPTVFFLEQNTFSPRSSTLT